MGKFFFTFVLLVFYATAQIANAQSAANATVHRKNAGTPNEHGWVKAESTEGRFVVDLPSTFNDITIADRDSSPALKAYSVGTTISESIRFLATRVEYRTPGYASFVVEQLEKGEGVPGKVVGKEKLRHQGFRAVSLLLWLPETFLAQQTLLVEEDTVTLMIEGPIEKVDSLRAIGAHFFDSLRVQ
jgi:hypothetical protein